MNPIVVETKDMRNGVVNPKRWKKKGFWILECITLTNYVIRP